MIIQETIRILKKNVWKYFISKLIAYSKRIPNNRKKERIAA